MKLSRRHVGFGVILATILGSIGYTIWWPHWSEAEKTNAQNIRLAMQQVRGAIEYANRQGGMLEEKDTSYLIKLYRSAMDYAGRADQKVLLKVHHELPKQWQETFIASTHLFVIALENKDRDVGRKAGLIQDDWVRWYNLNFDDMRIPDKQ